MYSTRGFDSELQMFREPACDVNVARLRFLRWLVEHGRLTPVAWASDHRPGHNSAAATSAQPMRLGLTRPGAAACTLGEQLAAAAYPWTPSN
jgi:hypothetical protein